MLTCNRVLMGSFPRLKYSEFPGCQVYSTRQEVSSFITNFWPWNFLKNELPGESSRMNIEHSAPSDHLIVQRRPYNVRRDPGSVVQMNMRVACQSIHDLVQNRKLCWDWFVGENDVRWKERESFLCNRYFRGLQGWYARRWALSRTSK